MHVHAHLQCFQPLLIVETNGGGEDHHIEVAFLKHLVIVLVPKRYLAQLGYGFGPSFNRVHHRPKLDTILHIGLGQVRYQSPLGHAAAT